MTSSPCQLVEPAIPGYWYAIQTRPRHEKAVVMQCAPRGVHTFLPLYTAKRKWKEHRAEVQLPLLPGYVFVRMELRDRLKVLTLPSVLGLVAFSGTPAAIPDDQIEALRHAVRTRRAEPCALLCRGARVRVTSGPLQGLEGIVLRRKDKVRVVVTFDWMSRSVSITLDGSDLEYLRKVDSVRPEVR